MTLYGRQDLKIHVLISITASTFSLVICLVLITGTVHNLPKYSSVQTNGVERWKGGGGWGALLSGAVLSDIAR